VIASAGLFGQRGYANTGIKQILASAEATFGSLYHYFPDGKEQLGAAAIRWSGEQYGRLVPAVFDGAPDVATATGDFFTGAAAHLRDTDYADACPIATVALEVANTNEPLRQATAEVFELWITTLSERFRSAGIDGKPARNLAISILAMLEGAFVLSRAMRSTEAVEIAGMRASAAVRTALDGFDGA